MWEYKTLTAGLESDSEIQLLEAVTTLRHARALKQMESAQKIAAKRSGTRGSDARKQLLVCEKQVADIEAELTSVKDKSTEMTPELTAATHATANELLLDIQSTLEAINAEATESNARVILLGLGFSSEQLDNPYSALSGGWRSRCTLAGALLQKPDLLILDEPTNYLDIPSVIWLQKYLIGLEETTILVVAHDRDFLDEVTEETIILREQKLAYHEGAISACERAAAKKRKSQVRMKDALDKKREAIEKSIAEGARAARKTGDDNKARMVKSRQKKLDNRWGAEVNEKGHKFKLNRDLGGYHLTSRSDVEIDSVDAPISLPFPDPEDLRFPGTLCSAANVTYRYSKTSPVVLDDVTVTVHPGDRVGLVRKNGEGKSTLVKLLIGQLKPTKGVVERHPRLRIGYYSQHSVEELTDPKVGAIASVTHFIEELKNRHDILIDDGMARGFLGSFGLQGRIATNPISTLSGGQKVRLALALIVYPAPDLLVLDEVSTHLDMDTNVGLMRALRGFKGAVLLVSHDRHLIRCVIEGGPLIPEGDELTEDEEDEASDTDDPGKVGTVYRVGPKGKLRKLENGVNQYVAVIEKRLK
ncbi:putative ABC transporter ATP-binding protein YheS OS=Escherichia coli O157:H7 GN=yheS PE=3 SV=1 [Rhizoctonia solani AG-1 IB]|uniref:Putative ABC transporter ATP-binding protein YheS n=1 Tax=Thanatephorus cucumeris (strain AG1-IB / isolate 7/3/14) TaxID=1108050 RepID=A0A0B7FHZ0_THACB|nr:putative ABC transporter ATP-binding protein YheS OS=Escherichia coli O157:H7 GN=yheS PE=3 SV=1 [Rhizoctonia solani AG-1 IB]